jgi:predicted lysophospholipase L1 biosynthesis ABC-type transport system permease subunit
VVNRSFVERFWGVDPVEVLGRTVGLLDAGVPELRVVGVVGDMRDLGPASPARPMVFVPRYGATAAGFAVRTLGDPEAAFAAIRSSVAQVDPRLPIQAMRTFESAASRRLGAPLFNTSLMSLFAGLAVLLSVVGLFGLMSYSVRQRRQEIGVRMALGARGTDILLETLGQASWPIGLGLLTGGVAAAAASRLLTSQLFGVGATDPLTFAASAALLGCVALVAAWAPARRASRIEPVSVLRPE